MDTCQIHGILQGCLSCKKAGLNWIVFGIAVFVTETFFQNLTDFSDVCKESVEDAIFST